MKIGFYAPMKPPDHPVPSGDRQMARLIVKALELAGHEVEIASRVQSWSSDPGAFETLELAGHQEAERLIREGPGYDAFLTYHLYHKAPDFVGPAISRKRGTPYLVVEASRALKRKTGPWARHFQAVDQGLEAADQVVALHSADSEGLRAVVPPSRMARLFPFLETSRFPAGKAPPAAGSAVNLLAVGMIRHGDKEASYLQLAEALRHVKHRNWSLVIAGDGPARGGIEAAFAGLPVRFAGTLSHDDLIAALHDADCLIWPAINEAFGMVFLEAQSCGVPVIGARVGGVPDIVVDGVTGLLARYNDPVSLAEKTDILLEDPDRRHEMGKDAAAYVRTWHDIDLASKTLDEIVGRAVRVRAERS